MREWICSWFRHKLRTVQTFPNGSHKQYCSRCKGYFIFNSEYEVFVPWNAIVEDHYTEVTGARTIL